MLCNIVIRLFDNVVNYFQKILRNEVKGCVSRLYRKITKCPSINILSVQNVRQSTFCYLRVYMTGEYIPATLSHRKTSACISINVAYLRLLRCNQAFTEILILDMMLLTGGYLLYSLIFCKNYCRNI